LGGKLLDLVGCREQGLRGCKEGLSEHGWTEDQIREERRLSGGALRGLAGIGVRRGQPRPFGRGRVSRWWWRPWAV